MNWKLIVGASLIFAGVKEFLSKTIDYKNGITHYNPIYAQLGCIAIVGLGAYLVSMGRHKKTFK